MMKGSNGFGNGPRRNSNHRIARIPRTICSGLGQVNDTMGSSVLEPEKDPIFFVLRAKGKELMLKMFDLDTKEQAKLADLKRGRKEG